MIKTFQKIINSIENSPISFRLWLAAFSGIIVLRLLVENWLENFRNRSGLFLFYEFTHTFLFFLISYILFAALVNKILKVEIKKAVNVLLWGFLIIVTPPIIDFIISKGRGFWSFYKFDSLAGLAKRFFTFFGDKPEIGITYGVRIEVALAIVFLFIYSLIKSKDIIKSLSLSFFSYLIFFVLGTFPSYAAILLRGFSKGFINVGEIDAAQIFLTPAKIFSREIPDIISALNIKMSLVYSLILISLLVVGCLPELLRRTSGQASLLFSRKKALSFFANARYPQLIYHGGLLIVGAGLAYIFTGAPVEINFFNVIGLLVLLSSVFFAWLASVVPNDIYDQESDRLTPNKNRPLIQGVFTPGEYKMVGWTLFIVSIFLAAVVNFKIALLLIVYQTIAWIYSCPPLRLKRFAFVSTFVSSIASLMILFSGYILISSEQNIKGIPFPLIALLVIGYTLALPIKDLKDIEGDKKNGVWTVPVLFGEYWGKAVVGGGLFLSFIASVAIFNEFRLFWWALICGAISFWIILSSGENKKTCPAANCKFCFGVTYKRLPWWILGIVMIYGIILVKIIFSDLFNV